VDGVRVGGEAVAAISAGEAERLIHDGTIGGGMALKVRVALEAARSVPEVVIAGRARLTGGFAGTRIAAAATEPR
jgi:acetylglutamate kinase